MIVNLLIFLFLLDQNKQNTAHRCVVSLSNPPFKAFLMGSFNESNKQEISSKIPSSLLTPSTYFWNTSTPEKSTSICRLVCFFFLSSFSFSTFIENLSFLFFFHPVCFCLLGIVLFLRHFFFSLFFFSSFHLFKIGFRSLSFNKNLWFSAFTKIMW